MQYYAGKVRLGGSPLNEVPKDALSAPEVIILQHIHGSDAIVDLRPVKSGRVESLAALRDELDMKYRPALASRNLSITHLFGPDHQPLPTHVPGVSFEADNEKTARRVRTQPPAAPSIMD